MPFTGHTPSEKELRSEELRAKCIAIADDVISTSEDTTPELGMKIVKEINDRLGFNFEYSYSYPYQVSLILSPAKLLKLID